MLPSFSKLEGFSLVEQSINSSLLQILNPITLMRLCSSLALRKGLNVQCQLSGYDVAANWRAVFRNGLSPALLMSTVAADKHFIPADIILSSESAAIKSKSQQGAEDAHL